LDSNDYAVNPAVIGRRIEVVADLDRVRVLCDGRVVADHERIRAKHQTITDPQHLAAAWGHCAGNGSMPSLGIGSGPRRGRAPSRCALGIDRGSGTP
jgi:hypothetical protein